MNIVETNSEHVVSVLRMPLAFKCEWYKAT